MKKLIMLLLIVALLQACGGRLSKKRNLDVTLYQYAKVMRWADFDQAVSYISTDKEFDALPTDLELARLKQFGVSSYKPDPILPGAEENSIIQNVEYKLYNKHTKREKIIIDHQVWTYNDDKKRWFLTSGLPELVH